MEQVIPMGWQSSKMGHVSHRSSDSDPPPPPKFDDNAFVRLKGNILTDEPEFVDQLGSIYGKVKSSHDIGTDEEYAKVEFAKMDYEIPISDLELDE